MLHTHGRHPRGRRAVVVGLAALAFASVASTAAAGAASSQPGTVSAAAVTPLVGTFQIAAGSCASGVTGSYFRMIQPGGTVNGPDSGYLVNADSACANQTYTLFNPGTDGGLRTGSYQPEPNPAFDGSGHSLANRIVQPASFFGVKFSVSTAATDPQTATAVAAPALSADGSTLTGNLRAFSAAWNNQHFNQGAPKPDGGTPGLTAGPTGTYNATTKAYTVNWTSQIVGGPFNGFTGQWHLTGTFTAGGPPTVGVGNAAVVEGTSGSRGLRFTVALSAKSASPVTASYTTIAGTAAAGTDFVAKSGTVTIPAGSTSALIAINVKGDAAAEPNETFKVRLSAPTGASITRANGTGTILNDDPAGGRSVSVGNAAILEGRSGSRALRFTVALSAKSASPVTASYTTIAGTAAAGTDFVAKSGTVTIPAGSTSALIAINVKGDAAAEPNETFKVRLSAPTGASLTRANGTGTILNDD